MNRLARLPWELRYVHGRRAAAAWRRAGITATHRHADVRIDKRARLGPRFALWIPEQGRFHAAAGCDFRRDFYAEVHGSGLVDIGPRSTFTGAATLQISTSLQIGERCVFGVNVLIADGNHKYKDHTRHLLDQGYDFQPIVIRDRAVVMTACTILASLGEGAVVGANSVVTRPVPDFCLAVGSPARVVEYFGPPDRRPAMLDADR